MQTLAKIIFLPQSTYTGAAPCQLWFDWDYSMTGQKAPHFEIDYSNNSQLSTQMSNPNKSILENNFVLQFTSTRTLYIKFSLIWTTLSVVRKIQFFKLIIRKNRKFLYKKLNFFLGRL